MKLLQLLGFACLLCLMAAPMALAADYAPADFLYSAPLLVEEGQDYTSVRLNPEIIGKANSNLADLLLIRGEEAVPYFINSYTASHSAARAEYEMVLADSFLKDEFQYLDYKLQSPAEGDIIATALNIQAAGQFVKDLTLYGSYDGLHWVELKNDTIYQVEGSSRLSLSLLPGEKYTWYRLRLSGNQEPVKFERMWLEYSLDTITQDFFVETISPDMTVEQDEKTTVITLGGLKNLTLSSIEIHTNSIFKRSVYVAGKAHTLYNLAFGSGHYRDLLIPMEGYQCLAEQLTLRIENKDDAPIQVDAVEVYYLAYDVVFANSGAPVMLYFGNSDMSRPPQYDIVSYKEHILAEGYSRAAVGQIGELPAAPVEAEPFDYSLLFNITIIIVAIVLAFVLLARLKKTT